MNTKKHFFIIIVSLIATLILCNFTEEISYQLIRKIYSKNILRTKIVYDSLGVPFVDYGYVEGIYVGKQRNPLTVSQRAIEYFESGKRKEFINCANWILGNSKSFGDYYILEYNFPWPIFNLTPPWRSGMAQAQAMQALIKAYDITKNIEYLDCASKLLCSFFIEIEDGGVTYKTANNGWWYEEYADEGCEKSMVLNGMMFTVIGIYEYYKYTESTEAKYLFEQGVVALRDNLYRYNKEGYSYYDILKHPAGRIYHKVYIQLLDSLYNITNEIPFKQYSNIWIKYKQIPFVLRMIKTPKKADVAIFVVNFLVLFGILEFAISLKRRKLKKK